MSKAKITRASNSEKKPVPWAETGVAGYYGGDPERPYMGFKVEVNSLADLARIAHEVDERLVITFNPDGVVEDILVYDDYLE